MHFLFPSILSRLDYIDRITVHDCRSLTLSFDKASQIIARYIGDMTSGIRFDQMVREPANSSVPHAVVCLNIQAANQIRARLAYAKAQPFLNKPLPGLNEIPIDADIFETDQYDGNAAGVLHYLASFNGIKTSVASKILHQKRPRLVPIFDELARRALYIPWTRGSSSTSYKPLFAYFRRFISYADNAAALDKLVLWVNSRTKHGRECQFSKVRTLDILAWSVIQYNVQ
ncbi:MAG TPA: DUF6308 family protein [Phycisphaerae bacterium]|jgi:hypothetical protein